MSEALPPERTKRRLTVVLASDVAGYSRLVGLDEEGTIRRFASISTRFRSLVETYSGRVFNTAGDAVLAEFPSAVDAVRCALDVHEVTRTENISSPPDRRIEFRIGVAVGDVIVTEGGDLLGDGVNIAARLQVLADKSGTCVSQEVWGHVHSKLNVSFRDLGPRELKNIANPVHAFAVGEATITSSHRDKRRVVLPIMISGSVAAAALLFLATKGMLPHRPDASISEANAFRPERVPFVATSERRLLSDFVGAPNHKAIALARTSIGVSVGESTKESAELKAMSLCNSRPNNGCHLYALDGTVVWNRPMTMPLAVDVRGDLAEAPDFSHLPLLSPGEKQYSTKTYFQAPNPKALAFGSRGLVGIASDDESRDDASRRALERCGDRNDGACLLYALDEQATQPLPKTHAIKGIFLFTNTTDIPSSERSRLELLYSGPNWRAMARNRQGGWYAVSGAASEDEAANAALEKCGGESSDCALYAIGNFLIDLPTR